MIGGYRKLLEIRKLDSEVPASLPHMEEACIILSELSRP